MVSLSKSPEPRRTAPSSASLPANRFANTAVDTSSGPGDIAWQSSCPADERQSQPRTVSWARGTSTKRLHQPTESQRVSRARRRVLRHAGRGRVRQVRRLEFRPADAPPEAVAAARRRWMIFGLAARAIASVNRRLRGKSCLHRAAATHPACRQVRSRRHGRGHRSPV